MKTILRWMMNFWRAASGDSKLEVESHVPWRKGERHYHHPAYEALFEEEDARLRRDGFRGLSVEEWTRLRLETYDMLITGDGHGMERRCEAIIWDAPDRAKKRRLDAGALAPQLENRRIKLLSDYFANWPPCILEDAQKLLKASPKRFRSMLFSVQTKPYSPCY